MDNIDLSLAETLWLEMIENSEDLSLVDSPDNPIKAAQDYSASVLATIYALLSLSDTAD